MNRRGTEGGENYRDTEFTEKRRNPSLNRITERVIGAAIEVHRRLGPGYLEKVYEQALAIEFRLRGTLFVRQHPVPVFYKGHPVGTGRIDFLVESRLLVELKTVDAVAPIHEAALLSYLKATSLPLALLINFKVPVLKQGLRRLVLT